MTEDPRMWIASKLLVLASLSFKYFPGVGPNGITVFGSEFEQT